MSEPLPEDAPLTGLAATEDYQGWKGGPPPDNTDANRLVNLLRSYDRRIRLLEGAAGLRQAGVRVDDAGMTIDSNLAITGTLSLPAGIIDNDALTNPVAYDAGANNSGALTLTSNEQTFCTYTMTVPAGYTRALVVSFGSVGVMNPTASPSSVAARIYTELSGGSSRWGPRWFQRVEPNFDGGTFPNHQTVFDVTGGQVITTRLVILNTGANWGATPGGATLNSFAIFTR